MIAKQYLQRGRDIQRQITQLYEKRSEFIDRATSTTMAISPIKVQTSHSGQGLENAIIGMVETEEEIRNKIAELQIQQWNLQREIQRVHGLPYKQMLYKIFIISPIIYGVIGALAVYAAYLGIVKAIELASAAASMIHSLAMSAKIGVMAALTGQTMAATAAQMGYNGALYACPVVWIIVLIIALIAVIMAVCSAIAKMTGIANSGFGVITGGVNVVIQFFKNLGLTVANIALGIGNAIAALASNMMTAFHNAICSVQSWFYNLLSTALSVIEGICSALNKLPFVEFDYSGISSAADDYAAKASEAAGNKEDYQSISDAFNEGFTTFDAFQDGWASDAFNAGAAWGDGVADKVSNFSLSDVFGKTDIPNVSDYTSGFNDAIANSGVGDSIGNIDDNTGKIKDSLEVSEDELKYLRDIAEQEAINRFTTAEINVDMSGMQNTVNSGDDIDGFMTKLTDSVNEAVDNMTEGVHE